MNKSRSTSRIRSKRSMMAAAATQKPAAKQEETLTQTAGTAWGKKAVAANNRMKIDPAFAAEIAKKIF